MDNPDKVKYYIHDAIKAILPKCKIPADLRFGLKEYGIELDYKFKRTTKEIEGVSFRYNNIAFKGSQIDRKFSFGNLKKEFEKNIEEAKKRSQEEYQQQQAKQKQVPPESTIPSIGGVKLTIEQWNILKDGGFVFLENTNKNDGDDKFSAYTFLNDEKNKAFFSKNNPDDFVKYGKYEMRIKDKILIENGYMTKAKVKWYGGGFAYPYLWKENKSDTEYKESWGDPRVKKEEKAETKKQIVIPKMKKDRSRKM